jgi:hypothetical protein
MWNSQSRLPCLASLLRQLGHFGSWPACQMSCAAGVAVRSSPSRTSGMLTLPDCLARSSAGGAGTHCNALATAKKEVQHDAGSGVGYVVRHLLRAGL